MTHAAVSSPFDGLDISKGNWELSLILDVDRQDYRDKPWSEFSGEYTIAAASRDGRWRLCVQPVIGYDEDGLVQQGAPLIDLRDQTTRPTPLEWLTGLMSGGAA